MPYSRSVPQQQTPVNRWSGQSALWNHYHPFATALGAMHMAVLRKEGAPDHRHIGVPNHYNGKEGQNEFGLGWYDYGARNYDTVQRTLPI